MPRKKKIKLLDTILDSIRKKWEKATLREIVYLISYMGAVAISYKALMAAKGLITSLFTHNGSWFQRLVLGKPPWEEGKSWLDELDLEVLLTSFAVAYMVLKIDMDDVVTASKQIGVLATKFT